MTYNREHNIDDLIELATGAEETFCLVLEDYDGKGAFSNPPYVYGLSQVAHIFRRHELQKTVEELLQQYPDGCQFFESKDEFNLMTDKNVRVTPSDTLEKVFGDERKVVLYLQNRAYSSCQLVQGDQGENRKRENQKSIDRFRWRRCMLIFAACWVLKFAVLFVVILLLKRFEVI